MLFLQRFEHPPTPASRLTNLFAGGKSPNRLGSSFLEDVAVVLHSLYLLPLMALRLWVNLRNAGKHLGWKRGEPLESVQRLCRSSLEEVRSEVFDKLVRMGATTDVRLTIASLRRQPIATQDFYSHTFANQRKEQSV